jgi:hypothetical protein
MANEISISAALSCSKNGANISSALSKVLTMAGTRMITNVQDVSTAEAVIIGDLTGTPYIFAANLDATNYVDFGLDASVTSAASVFARLQPGAVMMLPAKTGTIYAKSGSGTVQVLVAACEA